MDRVIDPDVDLKQCTKCRVFKARMYFAKDQGKSDGLFKTCKNCVAIRCKHYRITLNGCLMTLLDSAKARAFKRNTKDRKDLSHEFSLTFDELCAIYHKQEGKCYYFRTKELSLTSNSAWRISLERLNQSLGYTNDNCVLACLEFNVQQQWNLLKIKEMLTLRESIYDVSYLIQMLRFKSIRAKPTLKCNDPTHTKQYKNGSCATCIRVKRQTQCITPIMFLRRKIAYMKTRSRIRGHDTPDLEYDAIIDILEQQGGRCAISNVPLILKPHGAWGLSPERIDTTLGYSINNVILVCVEFKSCGARDGNKGKGTGAQWTPEKFNEWLQCLKTQ